MLLHDSKMIPVEVKSGATGSLRSLHSFMDNVDHHIAIRIYGGPVKIDKIETASGKIYTLLNLPFYLSCRIEYYLNWLITSNENKSL